MTAQRFWDEPSDDDKSLYDPIYKSNRDSEDDDVREFVEQLWVRYQPFCGDKNFLAEAKRHFNQFTWQMYSGVCLLEAGHTLEKAAPEGPDHKAVVSGRRVWVECIAPEKGEGDNRADRTFQRWTKTEHGGHGLYKPPSDEKIGARLTNAISNKVKQHRRWIEKGTVLASEPFVIAIGGGIIPDIDLDRDFPHIVHALFDLGDVALLVSVGSGEPAEVVPAYQDAIKRMSADGQREVSIPLRGFLDETIYPEVSAVIFCGHGVWNPPRKIGRDLVTIYNAVAKNPLPPGTIPLGRECWAEEILRSKDHREKLPDLEVDPETKKIIDEYIGQRKRAQNDEPET
jgi:hypothetical protein